MKLGHILDHLDEFDDELVIYTTSGSEISESTEAEVRAPPPDGALDEVLGQRQYLLEVRLAKEVIRVWSQWRGGRMPTAKDKCDAVSHYATYDSYLPP